MSIEERLKNAQTKLQETATKFNELESQKQELLKETFRLEGIIRELTLMRDENDS